MSEEVAHWCEEDQRNLPGLTLPFLCPSDFYEKEIFVHKIKGIVI